MIGQPYINLVKPDVYIKDELEYKLDRVFLLGTNEHDCSGLVSGLTSEGGYSRQLLNTGYQPLVVEPVKLKLQGGPMNILPPEDTLASQQTAKVLKKALKKRIKQDRNVAASEAREAARHAEEDRLQDVALKSLERSAKKGDTRAAKVLLDRGW